MFKPAVLVMAPGPATWRRATLAPVLGPAAGARLQTVLLRRAAAWAARTTPGAAFVALAPGAEAGEAPTLPGVDCFGQLEASAPERVASAVDRMFAAGLGPVIVVRPDFPRLGDYHASAALADLRGGCDVVLGVAVGGGLYLLGMREPQPELFGLVANDDDGETTRRNARQVTEGLELEVGMLHYERALVGPADALALLADPLAPADVARALAGAVQLGGAGNTGEPGFEPGPDAPKAPVLPLHHSPPERRGDHSSGRALP